MKSSSCCIPMGTGISYQLGFNSPVERCENRAKYAEICNSPKVLAVKQKVKELKAEAEFTADPELRKSLLEKADRLKRSLPVFMFMANYRGEKRRNDDAVLNGLVFIDYDHVDEPDEVLRKLFEEWGGKDEFCRFLGILLIKRSISGHGFHIVAKAQTDEGDIEDNQRWFDREVFHLHHDENCKDPARGTFATPMADHVWLSDELFTYHNPAFHELAKNSKSSEPSQPPVLGGSVAELIQAVENRALRNTTLGNAPGNHNNTLYRTALYLRAIEGVDEQWLLENLPRYNQSDSEFRATVHSACQAELPRGAKTAVKEAISEVRQQQNRSAVAVSNNLCPQLPTDLPPLIAHLSKNVPAYLKPAAIVSAMPALGALGGKIRLRYIDNSPHYTALMSVTVAGSATGKSAQNAVVKGILAGVIQETMQANRTVEEWKQKNQGRRNSKDKDPRPVVPKRFLPSDTTNASLWDAIGSVNPDRGEAGEYVFFLTDEIEMLTKMSNDRMCKKITQELATLIQNNYDAAYGGQNRVSLDAVNVYAPTKANWVTACTPARALQFFGDTSVTDGCLSRLLIATIIPPENDDMPIFGNYDEAWQQELNLYTDRIGAANGEIRSAEVDQLIRTIMNEQKEQADLASSDMMKIMLRREVKTAHRIAMLLYIAQDHQWDDRSARFIRWIVRYGIWTKMRFFGGQGEKEIQREQSAIRPVNTSSLLDQLPETFTRQQAINVRVAAGKPSEPKYMLQNWKRRGYIEQTADNVYRKIVQRKLSA